MKSNLILGEYTYHEYIDSPEWKDKRWWMLIINKDKCSKCGRYGHITFDEKGNLIPKVILQIHHKNYENLGNENQKDLIVLCKECHENEHRI